jgi:tetratricopeptide (TPR) repeat protein
LRRQPAASKPSWSRTRGFSTPQAGLRASARSLFQAGGSLDAAGDWLGALQKYEQARQVYAGIPGLAEGLKRVRARLRAAGTNAFNQARQHEAGGRREEALKEYDKAIQWLPAEDPNRQIARSRVEQLRKNH